MVVVEYLKYSIGLCVCVCVVAVAHLDWSHELEEDERLITAEGVRDYMSGSARVSTISGIQQRVLWLLQFCC